MYVCMYMYIYIYMYTHRERDTCIYIYTYTYTSLSLGFFLNLQGLLARGSADPFGLSERLSPEFCTSPTFPGSGAGLEKNLRSLWAL